MSLESRKHIAPGAELLQLYGSAFYPVFGGESIHKDSHWRQSILCGLHLWAVMHPRKVFFLKFSGNHPISINNPCNIACFQAVFPQEI